jgi:hypothetical protein
MATPITLYPKPPVHAVKEKETKEKEIISLLISY